MDKRGEVFANLINRLRCDITDNNGNHCPGDVAYRVRTNRGDAYLCDKCYRNVKHGAYKEIGIENVIKEL